MHFAQNSDACPMHSALRASGIERAKPSARALDLSNFTRKS